LRDGDYLSIFGGGENGKVLDDLLEEKRENRTVGIMGNLVAVVAGGGGERFVQWSSKFNNRLWGGKG